MYKLHVKETQHSKRHTMIPKYILTPNLGFLPQIIYKYAGLDLASTETTGQGHSDLETIGDSPGSKMYLHTKYGNAVINNIKNNNNKQDKDS